MPCNRLHIIAFRDKLFRVLATRTKRLTTGWRCSDEGAPCAQCLRFTDDIVLQTSLYSSADVSLTGHLESANRFILTMCQSNVLSVKFYFFQPLLRFDSFQTSVRSGEKKRLLSRVDKQLITSTLHDLLFRESFPTLSKSRPDYS